MSERPVSTRVVAPVDISSIRNGDEVLIRVVATGLIGSELVVEVPSVRGASHIPVGMGWVVDHFPGPRELVAGDEVQTADGSPGVIRAVVDDVAWVRLAPTVRETYKIAELPLCELKRRALA